MELKGDPLNGIWIRDFPVYDATSLAFGEALMLGTTAETDDGAAITAYSNSSAEAVDFVGICMETLTPTALLSAGGQRGKINMSPLAIYLIEYDLTTTMAVASYAAPTVTITSVENNWDSGWVYVVAGTGLGQLGYVDTVGSGVFSVDSNFATAVDSTSTMIKILPPGHLLTALNTTALKLKSQAAAGSGVSIRIISNYFKDDGHLLTELDPDTHQAGFAGLSNPKFYAEVIFVDHFMNVLA